MVWKSESWKISALKGSEHCAGTCPCALPGYLREIRETTEWGFLWWDSSNMGFSSLISHGESRRLSSPEQLRSSGPTLASFQQWLKDQREGGSISRHVSQFQVQYLTLVRAPEGGNQPIPTNQCVSLLLFSLPLPPPLPSTFSKN